MKIKSHTEKELKQNILNTLKKNLEKINNK